ncbi:MAG: hypothetical protein HYZ91_06260 [Candidatus Omnitrophica bacterium]|nr:hypothetical protein [Candidatus Omnitrophota bacterium]
MHSTGGLLLAAIGGYWVIERAEAHKGYLRKLGRVLGGAIIILSLLSLACRAWWAVSCKPGFMGKGGYCPFSMKSTPLPADPSSETSPGSTP